MGFNTEELKRKLDADESLQGGPIQKILKRSLPSTEQLSDIFSQTQFSLGFDDEDEDDFDMNSEFNDNEDILNQQELEQQPDQQQQEDEQQKTQQPIPPQRKKPGRKPNPASPALRKAQNRAAQRAFRERKERHLRELENTIKTLREDQYESLLKHQRETSHYQRENSHYRSLIEQLETENSFLKQVAFTFECALNNINGNNDATTKLKNAVSLSTSRPSSSLPLNGGIGSVNSPFGMGTMQMRQAVTLPSQQSVPTAQQIQNTFLGLFQSQADINGRGANLNVSSPATSNIMMSPNNMSTTTVSAASSPPTPESSFPPSTFFAEEFAREITLADMKPFVTSSPIPLFVDCNDNTYSSSDPSIFKSGIDLASSQLMSKSNSNSSTVSTVSSGSNSNSLNNDGSSSFMAEAASMIDNDADFFSALIFNDDLASLDDEESKQLFSNFDFNNANDFDISKRRSRDNDQIIRLSKKIGQPIPAPVIPKTRYPLTRQQKDYLTLEHDARIAMIPCLHLRSRMIQYRDQYDLYELVELLINKAKCHGDPLDPDAWELPEEFFERYAVLVFQHCRIKSSLYKKYGRLPKDFDNFYRKGLHLIS